MRWKLSEFFFELNQDLQRKVLFVEGKRDLAFWRSLIPSLERRNTVIYPISQLDCPGVSGGERGRMIHVAAEVKASAFCARVLFFVDADTDRIQGSLLPGNVVLTDGRDLEAYGISATCIGEICVSGFARDDESIAVLDLIRLFCRPIGILRVTSARMNWDLSFQQTLGEKGFRKLLKRGSGDLRLDLEHLWTSLLQNSSISLSQKVSMRLIYEDDVARLTHLNEAEIVHGKDLIHMLAAYFGQESSSVEALLFMSISSNIESLRRLPNLKLVEEWVRT